MIVLRNFVLDYVKLFLIITLRKIKDNSIDPIHRSVQETYLYNIWLFPSFFLKNITPKMSRIINQRGWALLNATTMQLWPTTLLLSRNMMENVFHNF